MLRLRTTQLVEKTVDSHRPASVTSVEPNELVAGRASPSSPTLPTSPPASPSPPPGAGSSQTDGSESDDSGSGNVGSNSEDNPPQQLVRPSEYLRRRCPLCFGGSRTHEEDEM